MGFHQPNTAVTISSTILLGCAITLGFIYLIGSRKKKWVRVGSIDQLFLYPVKGIPGIELFSRGGQPDVWMTELGVKCGALRDRSFILGFFNSRGQFEFMTMRTKPKLALITVTPKSSFSYVTLSAPGMPDVDIHPPQNTESLEKVSLEVWRSRGEGYICNKQAHEWFNKFMERNDCILLYADTEATGSLALRRPNSDPNHGKYAPKDMEMLFTDSSHMMLATDSSHDDVNRRLVDSGEPPVERRCWKASAWVTSLQGPYEEDMWEEVRFDEGPSFRRLRPCNRCMVTTVDFETGTHRKSRQPLVELRKYRLLPTFGESPMFGTLLWVTEPGPLKVGMDVFAVEKPFKEL